MTNEQIIADLLRPMTVKQVKRFEQGSICDTFGTPIKWPSIRQNIVKFGQLNNRVFKTKLNKEKTALAVIRIK